MQKMETAGFFATLVDCSWNVMAHAQKPDFVFQRKGRVHLNRRGRQFSLLPASRGVRISGSIAGYTMFRGSAKGTGYLLHSPVSPSFPLPFVTVCHHISIGVYLRSDSSYRPQSQQVALERTKPRHVWMDLNPPVPFFYGFPFLQQNRRHSQLIMPNLNKQ